MTIYVLRVKGDGPLLKESVHGTFEAAWAAAKAQPQGTQSEVYQWDRAGNEELPTIAMAMCRKGPLVNDASQA